MFFGNIQNHALQDLKGRVIKDFKTMIVEVWFRDDANDVGLEAWNTGTQNLEKTYKAACKALRVNFLKPLTKGLMDCFSDEVQNHVKDCRRALGCTLLNECVPQKTPWSQDALALHFFLTRYGTGRERSYLVVSRLARTFTILDQRIMMSLTKEKDKKRGRMGASLAKMLGLEDGPAQKALLERKRKNRAKILKLEANYLQGSNPSLCHRLGRGGPPNKANHEIHSALTDGFSVRLTYTTEYNLDDYIPPLPASRCHREATCVIPSTFASAMPWRRGGERSRV